MGFRIHMFADHCLALPWFVKVPRAVSYRLTVCFVVLYAILVSKNCVINHWVHEHRDSLDFKWLSFHFSRLFLGICISVLRIGLHEHHLLIVYYVFSHTIIVVVLVMQLFEWFKVKESELKMSFFRCCQMFFVKNKHKRLCSVAQMY